MRAVLRAEQLLPQPIPGGLLLTSAAGLILMNCLVGDLLVDATTIATLALVLVGIGWHFNALAGRRC